MRQKQEKTNAMRLLDRAGIGYEVQSYPHDGEAVDGIEVARLLGQDPASVFKTLVARGAGRNYYVFDIPVAQELDLKKAARAVGEKAVALVHVKELFPLTGYVRGGCSPVGMKKTVSYRTGRLSGAMAAHRRLRRQDWLPAAAGTGGPAARDGRPLCRSDAVTQTKNFPAGCRQTADIS